MAVADEKEGALATAAVAAVVGATVYGLRKALAGGGASSLLPGRDGDDSDDGDDESVRSRGGSFLESVWESASDSILPLADDAADAAGKWVAQNSPDLIRDRLLPRFIESFTDAA
jgi:hypothetical protein